jgi:hypothetical protein
MREVWGSKTLKHGIGLQLLSISGIYSRIKSQSGQHGFKLIFYVEDLSGTLPCHPTHPGPGERFYRVVNGVGVGSLQQLAMAPLLLYGLIIGSLRGKGL